MTSKKRRQRGSRTHGGGSSKNRRGAGHRGGRGNAGRKKHEIHGQDPLGKSGFTRPDSVVDDVAIINVSRLDEDAPIFAEADLAEVDGDTFRIDTREVLDVGADVDRIKVLGSGQVHRSLTVIADAFSDQARERLEAAGGQAILTTELETDA